MWFTILGIAYIILLMINFCGNGSVIYIFLKVKSLRTPSNMFVVNLALSDWCMMLTQVWKIKRQCLNHSFLFSGSPSHHQCIHSEILDVGHSRCDKSEVLTKMLEAIIPFIVVSRMQAIWIYWSFIWNSLNHDNDYYWIWQIQCYCEGSHTFEFIFEFESVEFVGFIWKKNNTGHCICGCLFCLALFSCLHFHTIYW